MTSDIFWPWKCIFMVSSKRFVPSTWKIDWLFLERSFFWEHQVLLEASKICSLDLKSILLVCHREGSAEYSSPGRGQKEDFFHTTFDGQFILEKPISRKWIICYWRDCSRSSMNRRTAAQLHPRVRCCCLCTTNSFLTLAVSHWNFLLSTWKSLSMVAEIVWFQTCFHNQREYWGISWISW